MYTSIHVHTLDRPKPIKPSDIFRISACARDNTSARDDTSRTTNIGAQVRIDRE